MATGALNIGEYSRELAEGHSKHHVYTDGRNLHALKWHLDEF